VTIAAGFVCPEGIVIAADTNESYGDSEHTYVNKIEVVKESLPGGSMRPHTRAAYAAIVGSGDACLVDHIVTHIKRIFRDNVDHDVAAFRQSLVELMPQLYASDAVTSYPHSDSTDLYTQLLVAARPNYNEKAALFLINSSLVTEVESGAHIIGCGTMQETARELWELNPDIRDTTIAALYLIYEAKRRYSKLEARLISFQFRIQPRPNSDQDQKEYGIKDKRNTYLLNFVLGITE